MAISLPSLAVFLHSLKCKVKAWPALAPGGCLVVPVHKTTKCVALFNYSFSIHAVCLLPCAAKSFTIFFGIILVYFYHRTMMGYWFSWKIQWHIKVSMQLGLHVFGWVNKALEKQTLQSQWGLWTGVQQGKTEKCYIRKWMCFTQEKRWVLSCGDPVLNFPGGGGVWGREYWTIYRGLGFLAVVWFGSSPSRKRTEEQPPFLPLSLS